MVIVVIDDDYDDDDDEELNSVTPLTLPYTGGYDDDDLIIIW